VAVALAVRKALGGGGASKKSAAWPAVKAPPKLKSLLAIFWEAAAEHALAVSSESSLESELSGSSRAWLKIFEEKQQEEQRALAQQKGTNQEKRQG
jgi:hypothetical protein